MKRILAPQVRARNELEHLAETTSPIEVLAKEGCTVEVPCRVEDYTTGRIGSILVTLEHMEHALVPFALLRQTSI